VLGAEYAGEVLTLQRAAYITEAQAHRDVDLPPLRQLLSELTAELNDQEVLAAGWRDEAGRLVAAVRVRVRQSAPTVAEVGRLTVVPDRQGQGLGSSLLMAVDRRLPASVTDSACSPESAARATCGCTSASATPRPTVKRYPPATPSSTSPSTATCRGPTRPDQDSNQAFHKPMGLTGRVRPRRGARPAVR